jgi:hypothetical protein
MELLSLLKEEILPQLAFNNDLAKIRTFHQYMNAVCEGSAARQWRLIKMNAKKDIISSYTTCNETKSYFIEVENRDEIIVGRNFKTWLEDRKAATEEELTYMEATSGEELYTWLVESFHYHVIDYMNKLIFSEEVHKVLDHQIEYLTNRIIKPFGIGVKVSFERIELLQSLQSYLKFFPPTTKKDEFPTLEAHKEHEGFIIVENKQQKIYFNVLPEEAYQQNFITHCEKDYTLMTDEEFLNGAIHFEKSDKVMREKKLKLQQVCREPIRIAAITERRNVAPIQRIRMLKESHCTVLFARKLELHNGYIRIIIPTIAIRKNSMRRNSVAVRAIGVLFNVR